jgi:hypothetical protein
VPTTFFNGDNLILRNRKRQLNENKFKQWIDLSSGGRSYWYEIEGKLGYKARYVKEVDEKEDTLKFYQEIYNNKGILVEIHEKYPVNKGHQKIGREV